MKVLLITGIFPPDIGGPATYVPQIAAALSEREHVITVVTLADRLDHDDEKYPFAVVRLQRQSPRPWRMARTVVTVAKIGRSADVLFVNGLALEAALANLILRKPLVIKVVGDLAWERAQERGWTRDGFEDFQGKRYGPKVQLLKALRTWWTRRSHRIIVPSCYLADWVARWGIPSSKIIVIHNVPEPTDGVRPAVLPMETFLNAVTVGRLVPWKRIDQILEAVSRIRELGLVVIGEGPERTRLRKIARDLGVTDRVYFAGRRGKNETLALMAACDLLVLNSTYEGLPHVLLEAMALGVPVVATAVGGTPEVVRDGENGLLLPPADSDALLAALRRLCADDVLRRRLGERGRTRAPEALRTLLEATETVLNEH